MATVAMEVLSGAEDMSGRRQGWWLHERSGRRVYYCDDEACDSVDAAQAAKAAKRRAEIAEIEATAAAQEAQHRAAMDTNSSVRLPWRYASFEAGHVPRAHRPTVEDLRIRDQIEAWHAKTPDMVRGAVDAQGRRQGWWTHSLGYREHYVDGELQGPNGGADAAVVDTESGEGTDWYVAGQQHRDPAAGPACIIVDAAKGETCHEYWARGRITRRDIIDTASGAVKKTRRY